MVYKKQTANELKSTLSNIIKEVLQMWKIHRTTPVAVYGWASSSDFEEHSDIPRILILPIDIEKKQTLKDGAQKLVDQMGVHSLAFIDLKPHEVIVGVESNNFCDTKKLTIETHGDVKVLKEPEPYITPVYLGVLYKEGSLLN